VTVDGERELTPAQAGDLYELDVADGSTERTLFGIMRVPSSLRRSMRLPHQAQD
jgi:hypothetical protein